MVCDNKGEVRKRKITMKGLPICGFDLLNNASNCLWTCYVRETNHYLLETLLVWHSVTCKESLKGFPIYSDTLDQWQRKPLTHFSLCMPGIPNLDLAFRIKHHLGVNEGITADLMHVGTRKVPLYPEWGSLGRILCLQMSPIPRCYKSEFIFVCINIFSICYFGKFQWF